MSEVERRYLYVGDRRVHYRRSGVGPALVMLHACPGSSFTLERLIADLSTSHSVVALDTPGYGESERLAIDDPTIADYANALLTTLDVLGIERTDLLGSHTGSKIALELARRKPGRVRRLVLDGLGIHTQDELRELLDRFTPPIDPVPDGSHLARIWAMRRDMFVFLPWYDRSAGARRDVDLPPALELHHQYVDFLRAGVSYGDGLRAAFQFDGLTALRETTAPTLLLTSHQDVIAEHLGRTGTVPPNVTVRTETGDEFSSTIEAFLAEGIAPNPPPPPPVPGSVPGRIRRDYLKTSAGQLLMRRSGDSALSRPLVLLHSAPGSAISMEPMLLLYGKERPVFAFDLPGLGDSAPAPGVPDIWDLAEVIAEGLDALGIESFDVYGTHTGALVAMELAIARPDRVRHAILDGITLFDDGTTDDRLTNYCPPLEVTADGGYLMWAWHFRRDMALWSPWYRRTARASRLGVTLPTAEALHTMFVEFMKGSLTYHFAYRAAFSYPTRERLPLVECPILHCVGPHDSLRAGLDEAIRISQRGVGRVVPTGMGALSPETIDVYNRFLSDLPVS